jgi:hypothetical protein
MAFSLSIFCRLSAPGLTLVPFRCLSLLVPPFLFFSFTLDVVTHTLPLHSGNQRGSPFVPPFSPSVAGLMGGGWGLQGGPSPALRWGRDLGSVGLHPPWWGSWGRFPLDRTTRTWVAFGPSISVGHWGRLRYHLRVVGGNSSCLVSLGWYPFVLRGLRYLRPEDRRGCLGREGK